MIASEATLKYLDYPTEMGGVTHQCMCSDEQRAPTHRLIEKMDVTHWCKRCGLQLPLKVMDAYFQTDDYKIEAKFQAERQEQKLWAAKENRSNKK